MTTNRVDFVSESGSRYAVVTVQEGEANKTGFYRDGKLLKRGMFVSEENYPQLFKEYKTKLQSSRTTPMSISDLEEWLEDWKEPVDGVGRICDLLVDGGKAKLTHSSRIDTSKPYVPKPSGNGAPKKSVPKAQPLHETPEAGIVADGNDDIDLSDVPGQGTNEESYDLGFDPKR